MFVKLKDLPLVDKEWWGKMSSWCHSRANTDKTFPPSSFWFLTLCKNCVITWMTSVSTQVDRGGGRRIPDWKNSFCTTILRQQAASHSASQTFGTPALGQMLQGKVCSSFFQSGTPPPFCLHWHHLHYKMNQAFPLYFLQSVSNQNQSLKQG